VEKCGACGATLVFAGARRGGIPFCDPKCATDGAWAAYARQWVPEEEVERRASLLFAGPCPKCRGPGPVDVHATYFIWSAIVASFTSMGTHVACDACARSRRARDVALVVLLGWWSWVGIFLTPFILYRALTSRIVPRSAPSDLLRGVARRQLAEEVAGVRPGWSLGASLDVDGLELGAPPRPPPPR
jgi:hypothetical protein